MDKFFCVYMHISPSQKRYIGLTSKPPKKRWDNGWGYKENNYFMNAIRKYGWKNFDHIIICTGLSKEQASWLEKELISKYKSNIPQYGYNISAGGFGGGHPTSEETKQKISKAKKGRPCPEHQKKHLSEVNKGIIPTNLDDVHKRNQKRVDQFDMDMNYIASFPSIRIAARECGINENSLGLCCRKVNKTAGGYIWQFSI